MADRPEHCEDEDETGDVETNQKLAEGEQRAGTEFADGKGDGSERAERRRPHDNGDDAKKHLCRRLDQTAQRFARLPHPAQGKSAQHRDKQHLQNVALAERADECVGDDVEQKLRRGAFVRLLEIRRHTRRVDMGKIDVHAGAGLEQIDREEPDDQRNRGQHLEIDRAP